MSASVAVTGSPTFSPAAVFSATERLTATGLNTGTLLVGAVVPVTVTVADTVAPTVQLRPELFHLLKSTPFETASSKAKAVPSRFSVRARASVSA